jgi:diphosphomevalonate decarboxylase
MRNVTVQAYETVSLNKYWGRRDDKLFLPTKSSLAVPLSELKTVSTLSFSDSPIDSISFNWKDVSPIYKKKIVNFLDCFRNLYGINKHFNVVMTTPKDCELISNASGFASLSLGLNEICQLGLSKKEISILARKAAGMAARSVCGGFVLWHRGRRIDGMDCFAEPISELGDWKDLHIIIAAVEKNHKNTSLSQDMQTTVKTSPSYKKWIEISNRRLSRTIDAIKARRFSELGELVEADCNDMTQSFLDSSPRLDYFIPTSFEVMNTVKNLREHGIDAYFTTDAGPHVKILCLKNNVGKVKSAIGKIRGVSKIVDCTISCNPQIVSY